MLLDRKQATHVPQIQLYSGGWQHLEGSLEFGTPSRGGHKTMDAVLRAAKEVEQELMGKHGLKLPLHISAHLVHELAVPADAPLIGATMSAWNKPRAIELAQWREGVKSGIYPQIGKIVPGNFGFPGSRDGGLTNPDPARRQLAKDALLWAIREANFNDKNGLGCVFTIYWDGEDQIKADLLRGGEDPILSYENNPKMEDWRLIVDGIVEVVKKAREEGLKAIVLVETKPSGDPGATSVFTDNRLAIQAINEMNQLIGGDPAVIWQDELLHGRLSGVPGWKGLEEAIAADVFDGHYHFNIGKLGPQHFPTLLWVGTPLSQFATHMDPDWLPGEGPDEWVRDQRAVLRLAALWSSITGKPFVCEYDAKWVRDEDADGSFLSGCIWTLQAFRDEADDLGLPSED